MREGEFSNPNLSMAIEEALTRSVGTGLVPNTMRFWRNKNCVCIGRFQCPRSEASFNSCLKHKTLIVRRFTGGGAVYQDSGNINLSIFLHTDNGIKAKCEVFKKISMLIAQSLKKFGISPTTDGTSILVGNRKISGISGAVLKGVVLAHCCILINSDLRILGEVLNLSPRNRNGGFVQSQVKEVTSLCRELGYPLEIKNIENAVKESFQEVFDLPITEEILCDSEFTIANNLYTSKYSKQQWTIETCMRCQELEKDLPFLTEILSAQIA